MQNPELIWRLGEWIARRDNGAARLAWSGGEAVLRIHDGKVVSFEGPDPGLLAARFGCQPTGARDLLEEAHELSTHEAVTETQTIGAVKEMVQEAVRSWMLDPARELELVEGEPDLPEGPTISITHVVVELVLSDTTHNVYTAVLTNRSVLLSRTRNFVNLYAPLRLSEEADLILANITGERTAEEIAAASPHDPVEVLRLLAALVAAGILEVRQPAPERRFMDEDLLPATPEEDAPIRRKLPLGAILGVAVSLLGVLAAVTYYVVFMRTPEPPPTQAATPGHYGLVVDMGCEPQDLARIAKRANEHPDEVRAVRAPGTEAEECWRLVWGEFGSQEEAEDHLDEIPDFLEREGFAAHAIELPETAAEGGAPPG